MNSFIQRFNENFTKSWHHHHFWQACTINSTCSATHSQQPPERSVLLSQAASAWWGFTTADDHQRLETVIRRGICSSFYSADQSPLSELMETADDHLFNNNPCKNEHVLNSVLPSSIQLMYELRHSSNYFNFGYRYPVVTVKPRIEWINESVKIRQGKILKTWYRYIKIFSISVGVTIRYDILISN